MLLALEVSAEGRRDRGQRHGCLCNVLNCLSVNCRAHLEHLQPLLYILYAQSVLRVAVLFNRSPNHQALLKAVTSVLWVSLVILSHSQITFFRWQAASDLETKQVLMV